VKVDICGFESHIYCVVRKPQLGRCNISVFLATKNMSFLKIFLQLCEACSF
jgi:hypothetical protein